MRLAYALFMGKRDITTAQQRLLRAAFLAGADSEHGNGSLWLCGFEIGRRNGVQVKADYRSIHALGDAGLVTWRSHSFTYDVRGRFGRGGVHDSRLGSGVTFTLTAEGKAAAAELRLAEEAPRA